MQVKVALVVPCYSQTQTTNFSQLHSPLVACLRLRRGTPKWRKSVLPYVAFVFISFKVINNLVPDYLLELKPEKNKEGRYMLRTRYEYTIASCRITKYNKSFLPFAVHLWNNLEKETQSITTYERFKDTLDANVRENPLFLVGTRQEQFIMSKLRM